MMYEIFSSDLPLVTNNLNTNKPTTYDNIPVKTLLENHDIYLPLICKILNKPPSKFLKELCMIRFTNTWTHIYHSTSADLEKVIAHNTA